jgi:hypothetical protein
MKEYAEDGIHVGHVIVDGAIAGDKIFKRFPDAASREESLISIEAIVNASSMASHLGVGHLRLTSERHAKSGERGMPAPCSEYPNPPANVWFREKFGIEPID